MNGVRMGWSAKPEEDPSLSLFLSSFKCHSATHFHLAVVGLLGIFCLALSSLSKYEWKWCVRVRAFTCAPRSNANEQTSASGPRSLCVCVWAELNWSSQPATNHQMQTPSECWNGWNNGMTYYFSFPLCLSKIIWKKQREKAATPTPKRSEDGNRIATFGSAMCVCVFVWMPMARSWVRIRIYLH